MQAKEIAITAPRRAELRQFELDDRALGPGEVVIRTRVTLLSGGTEGAFFQAIPLPGRERLELPFLPGYANVGEVIAAGPAAHVQTGDTIYTMGRHASVVRMNTATRPCVRVPDDLPAEEAVFARLITVPLTTLRVSRARGGDRTAVVGLGLVGNLGAQVMREAGMDVTGVDLIPERRALALRCGIERVVDPREPDAVRDEHRLVLEATGSAKGTVTALALTQLGGEVSLVGTPWVADPSVPASVILEAIHIRYVTVLSGWEWQLPIVDVRGERSAIHQPGSIAHSSEYALDLLRRGRIHVRELVTHRYKPEDCQAAYEGAVDRKAEQLGALFLWPE